MGGRGIYAIVDTLYWFVYVGAAENFRRRFLEHNRDLKIGRHHNSALQADCAGIDGVRWQFVVLEPVPRGSVRGRERHWISRINPEYSLNRIAREDARALPTR
jgi:hypothetical protein